MSLLDRSDRLLSLGSENRRLSTQALAINIPKSRAQKLKSLADSLRKATGQRDALRAKDVKPQIDDQWVQLVSSAIASVKQEISQHGEGAFSDSQSAAFRSLDDRADPLVSHLEDANKNAWGSFIDRQLEILGVSGLQAAQPDPQLRTLTYEANQLAERLRKARSKVPNSAQEVSDINVLIDQIKQRIEEVNRMSYPKEVREFMLKVQYQTATVADLTSETLEFLKERGLSRELRVRR